MSSTGLRRWKLPFLRLSSLMSTQMCMIRPPSKEHLPGQWVSKRIIYSRYGDLPLNAAFQMSFPKHIPFVIFPVCTWEIVCYWFCVAHYARAVAHTIIVITYPTMQLSVMPWYRGMWHWCCNGSPSYSYIYVMLCCFFSIWYRFWYLVTFSTVVGFCITV